MTHDDAPKPKAAADPKPEDSKPAETKSAESKPNESKPDESKHALPKPTPRAKRILFVLASIVVGVAAVILVLSWFFTRRAEAKDRRQREATEKLGPKLTVMTV
jgi:multisubunit Na+/H+ antiporter MnhC subunit